MVAAVDAGLVGEQGIRNLSLGQVTVRGDTAAADLMYRGEEAPVDMEFVREGGRWRIDLLPLIRATSTGLIVAAREQGTTVDELIGTFLEAQYGPAKAKQVLEPIGRG